MAASPVQNPALHCLLPDSRCQQHLPNLPARKAFANSYNRNKRFVGLVAEFAKSPRIEELNSCEFSYDDGWHALRYSEGRAYV